MSFADELNLGYCINTKTSKNIIQAETQDLEDCSKKTDNSSPFSTQHSNQENKREI